MFVVHIGAGNLANGAAEIGGVIEVDGVDGPNGAGANRFRRDPGVQSGERENCKLGASVAAIEVFGGVGFSVSAGLSFFERLAKRNAGIFDAAQNVVAGAVENSRDAVQAIAGQARAKRWQNGHASGNGSAEFEVTTVPGGELKKFGTVASDELFVGRYNGLARLERTANDLLRGGQATDEFDDDLRVGLQH